MMAIGQNIFIDGGGGSGIYGVPKSTPTTPVRPPQQVAQLGKIRSDLRAQQAAQQAAQQQLMARLRQEEQQRAAYEDAIRRYSEQVAQAEAQARALQQKQPIPSWGIQKTQPAWVTNYGPNQLQAGYQNMLSQFNLTSYLREAQQPAQWPYSGQLPDFLAPYQYGPQPETAEERWAKALKASQDYLALHPEYMWEREQYHDFDYPYGTLGLQEEPTGGGGGSSYPSYGSGYSYPSYTPKEQAKSWYENMLNWNIG